MLAAERQAAILDRLTREPAVRISGLALDLGVSEMTVRRDIDVLEARGSVVRVHGGAVRPGAMSSVEAGFDVNRRRSSEAKRLIATAAMTLLTPGMTVSITGGSTTFALAPLLMRLEGLTVITNSLPLAEELHRLEARAPRDGAPQVLVTGGQLTPSKALVGPLATGTLASLRADLCFMGAHGLDPEAGITTPNLAEADTNRAFARTSAQLVLLADSTKLGVVSLARVDGVSAAAAIVTDREPPGEYAALTRIIHGYDPAARPDPPPDLLPDLPSAPPSAHRPEDHP